MLAEFADLAGVMAQRAALAAEPIPGVTETVTGARTLLLRFDATTDAAAVARALRELPPVAPPDSEADVIEVPVVYDGEDLEAVGAMTGLGADGVVREHTARLWRSAFCGFAPGFSYLTSDGASLEIPRRPTPRVAVPAGAVALAGEFSAVYPRTSPGGWQLIGRTEMAMWDLERDPAALLPPGTPVRFVAVEA